MQPIVTVWNNLAPAKRIIAGLAFVTVFAAVLGIARMASQPSMAMLYASLNEQTSGEVLSALEARGAAYQVRGSSIYVDSSVRDALRMELAGQGLPRNGSAGYELLDNLNGFGTTSQMFDAAYWRAKEGELARTISANPTIRAARVHITNGQQSSFARRTDAAASVTVSTRSGPLQMHHAEAIQFLVASAVTGLSPQNVSIIDDVYGLVDVTGKSNASRGTENSLATSLKSRVERMLEAHVGLGNARVEVSVETVRESESIREVIVDPDSRVAISTSIEERSTSENGRNGQVTVASNLPDGDAGGNTSNSENTETREQTNFEVSQTQRDLIREPGAIKRLSIAVLVNEAAAPQPAILTDLKELVEAAVGYDASRGDSVTLKAMPFEAPAPLPEMPAHSLLDMASLDLMSLIQMAVLGLVVLFVGLFIIRPILKSGTVAAPQLAAPQETDNPPPNMPALNGEISSGEWPAMEMATMDSLDFAGDAAPDPVARLRQIIEDRHDETVDVLRRWIDQPQEKVE